MIFQGETSAQWREKLIARCKPQPWKKWFAWHPVEVGEARTAWLQFVERRVQWNYSSGIFTGDSEYREIRISKLEAKE